MWRTLRFVYGIEAIRAARSVEVSLSRIGATIGELFPPGELKKPRIGRLATRRGMIVAAIGLGMPVVALAVLASSASAQIVDRELFGTVDEAGRALLAFLTGGDGERHFEAFGKMVFLVNLGVFALVGFLLIYQVTAGVVETGRRGFMGFEGWGIVRMLVAAVMMAPIPYGPSPGQSVVVGLAGLGGDFAQSVWEEFSVSLLGDSRVAAPRASEGVRRTMMVDLMVVETCHAFAGPRGSVGPVVSDSGDGTVWSYRIAHGGSGADARSHCGSVQFAGLELDGHRGTVARAHRDALRNARTILRGVAEDMARTFVPEERDNYGRPIDEAEVRAAIDGALASYSGTVDAAIEEAGRHWHGDAVREVAGLEARDGSWTMAGAMFNRMAARMAEFNWSAVSGPEVSRPALELKERSPRTFHVVAKLGRDIVRIGGGREIEFGSVARNGGAAGGGVGGALGQLIWALLFDFEDVLQVGDENPMFDLAALGHNMITYVLTTLTALMGMALASNVGDTTALGFRLPLDAFEAMWPVIDGTVTLVLNLMLIAGAVLAYVLPALPFIRFMFGILAWILDVVEAFVVVTVWLASQVTPTEGRQGLVTQTTMEGLRRLLGVLLRPPLMILGLVIGYFVFITVVGLLNEVWMPQMRSAVGQSGPGLVGYVAQLAIYVMVAWGLLNISMRLIEALPEAALEWIGGRVRSWGGADQVVGTATGGAGRMSGFGPRGAGGRGRGGTAPTGGP